MKRKWLIVKWLFHKVRSHMMAFIIITSMSAVLSLCKVFMAIVSKDLIDYAVDGIWDNVIQACIFFTIIVLLQIGLKGGIQLLSVRTSELMSNQLRYQLFSHLSNIKWMDYTQFHSGDIVTRVTSDVGIVVGGLVNQIPEIIALSVGLIAALITLLVFDPVLAVFAFLLGPIAIVMSYVFGKRFMNIHRRAQEAESNFRSYVQECLEHMLVIKTFCKEKDCSEYIARLQEEKKRLAIKKSLATVIACSFVTGGFWLSYLLAFGWSAIRLYKGTITFGSLTAFLQLIAQVQSPFLGLAGTLPQVMESVGSAKRLMELDELEKEQNSYETLEQDFTQITFNNLFFEYKENTPVLNNVTASIKQGETIGLVGKSGQGKTTLIHLLMQLLLPVSGNIYFHYGHDEKYMAEAAMRSLIAYVPQGNTLFSGTITYNLEFGDKESTKEDLIAALEDADAWDFINQLPDGLNTVIGERGVGLSEGQAQRIAIARALLRKVPILILDEATSALDTETEKKVLETIVSKELNRTCIVITHRPSMLKYCKKIWKIDNGELFEAPAAVNEVAASEVT